MNFIEKLQNFRNQKETIMKNNVTKIKLFLQKNLKHKPSKFKKYVVRKLLNLIIYTQNVSALWFRTLVNQINIYLSWLCVVMVYMLQFGWSAIHRNVVVAWVVFVKAIFSCLNLKHNDGFLPCNMPNVFDKAGYGLTDAVIAWDEFKPVLYLGYFWE